MEIKDVKLFLDSCHAAKRIVELMPKLPKGLTPRHIHVIEAIWQISQEYGTVKISDVSLFLRVTRPQCNKTDQRACFLGRRTKAARSCRSPQYPGGTDQPWPEIL